MLIETKRWLDDKRACWAISLIAWALRVLTPDIHRRQIHNWAHNYTANYLYLDDWGV